MAAGGLVVSRRRDVHYSKKENYHPRNGYHDLDLSQGHGKSIIRGENGYGSYLGSTETDNGRDSGGRSRGFVRRTRDCELGELSGQGVSGDGISSKSGSRNNEISKLEDGELMPSEKRRKFSPIVWDRDAKEVRITSKSTLVQRVTPLCPPPPLPESFGTLVSVAADGDAAMHILPVQSPVAAESIWNSESGHLHNLPSVLSPEQCRRKDQELGGQLKAENVGFRHVSASRWAYEEYSPRKICSDNTGDISLRRRVEHDANLCDTPESGEFCREGSEGSWGNSSASDGRCILMEPASRGDYTENQVDDGIMEMDEKHDEAAGVSIADWDVEDDKESSTVQGCRSLFEYEMISKINEGTYGVVYKARDKRTREIMALKKVKMGREREGFPLSSLREINLLLCLHHPSIVVVKEVVVDEEDGVFMVMEYMERDLKELTEVMKQPFSEREVKCLMRQLLEGVQYLHDNWVLHRDLKTSNLLLNNSGKLKICDFGLSRQFGSPLKPYTPLVVTLWYRAPELLLGTKGYSTAIDMWSVGCIMAELLAKQPLFNGNTEIEQLDKIFRVLGTPSEKIWPGFSKLPGAKVKFVKHSRNTLLEKFPRMSFKGSPVLSEQGFDLLSQLLTYDPEKRISAEAALKHNWFHVESEPDVSVQESLARRLKLTTYG